MDDFLSDIKTLRARARQQIEEGPITEAYGADLDRVIGMLGSGGQSEPGVISPTSKRHSSASSSPSSASTQPGQGDSAGLTAGSQP